VRHCRYRPQVEATPRGPRGVFSSMRVRTGPLMMPPSESHIMYFACPTAHLERSRGSNNCANANPSRAPDLQAPLDRHVPEGDVGQEGLASASNESKRIGKSIWLKTRIADGAPVPDRPFWSGSTQRTARSV
jgi:hypothetical protein